MKNKPETVYHSAITFILLFICSNNLYAHGGGCYELYEIITLFVFIGIPTIVIQLILLITSIIIRFRKVNFKNTKLIRLIRVFSVILMLPFFLSFIASEIYFDGFVFKYYSNWCPSSRGIFLLINLFIILISIAILIINKRTLNKIKKL
jgi:hypothetical protein